MPWTCPLCGYQNDESASLCMCGFQADETILSSSDMEGSDDSEGNEEFTRMFPENIDAKTSAPQKQSKKIKVKVPEKTVASKSTKASDELLIKEIDSWTFTYSERDKCVYLGTPALQAFRLKLTLNDIEELLESVYRKAGVKKTTRNIGLSGEGVPDVIDIVDKMIEDKKSKIRLQFSSDELQEIADLINRKLTE